MTQFKSNMPNWEKADYIVVSKAQLNSLMCELHGVSSSLHMYPEPRTLKPNEEPFISNTDAWANHAESHLLKATKALRELTNNNPTARGLVKAKEA